MRKQLIVCFHFQNGSLIYQGQSRLRKNLADEISIYHDKIVLSFERNKPVTLQNCLFSQKSLFRYEIQKSLCFYLAVTGMLPEIKEIVLEGGAERQVLEEPAFAEEWSKCRVARRLEPGTVVRIFQNDEEAKAAYIALTFYLKAQLDHFSHDRFRAAWSGLNVLYTNFTAESAPEEWKKINAMKQYFEKDELEEVRRYAGSLDEAFWKKLDWYSFVRNFCTNRNGKVMTIDKVKQTVFDLRDAMLITKVTDYMRSVVYTDQDGNYGKQSDYQRCSREIERKIKTCGDSDAARAQFLVADYCYMLRNRSFHATKAYPLFTFGTPAEERTVEEILTELILMTMEGILRATA